MAALNPLQLMMALKNGNPQQVAMQIIQQNYANDPTMMQLLQMGQSNDIQGINKFAQQYFAQQGRDFNKEFSSFMNAVRNM